MPTVTPDTTYPDGQPLVASEHNSNIYSATAGKGVVSTLNGQIDGFNLKLPGGATSDLIMPGQVAQPSSAETSTVVQTFGDLFGGELTTHSEVVDAPVNLRAIPGLGFREHFGYAPSVIFWEWSYFINPQRWSLVIDGEDSDVREGLAIIGTKIDGVLIEESLRPIPFSLFLNTLSTSRKVQSRTGHCSLYTDMHYPQIGAAAGWHTLEVCIYLENLQRSATILQTDDIYVKVEREDAGVSYLADVTNAAAFGVRDVRVMGLY